MSQHHPILEAFLKAGGGPADMQDPLARALKGRVLEMGEGRAVLSFEPDLGFTQGAGVIQGGVVGALLDYAIAIAAFSRLAADRTFGTVSLTAHFLKPAPPGLYRAVGTLDRMGSSMIFGSGVLYRDKAETPTATATAVMATSRT